MKQNLILAFKKGILNNGLHKPIRTCMSSVALILRPSNDCDDNCSIAGYQLLMLRRKVIAKDVFSGHLCLPGGKSQQNETNFETVIRQTKQQTGITLTQKDLVTIVNQSFIAKTGRNISTVRLFIFYLQKSPQIALNMDQMCEYKWIKLTQFLVMNNFVYIQQNDMKYNFLKDLTIDKDIKEQIKINYVCTKYPAIQIGMGNISYGFTFYLIAHFLMKTYLYLTTVQQLTNELNDSFIQYYKHVNYMKVQFKQDYQKSEQMQKIIIDHYRQTWTRQQNQKAKL